MHNGCIVRGGVGSGKTHASLGYYVQHELGLLLGDSGPVAEDAPDLYVITTARKRDSLDWEKTAAQFAISRVPDASLGGRSIRVDSWNNITAYRDVEGAFFIFDEQRLVGSGAWVKAFLKIAKANRWIMLSATPGDNWMDYIPVFVANGWYKNRTEFLRTHVVYNNFTKFPKVDHYVEVGRLKELRRKVLVEMPFERHTTRHVRFTKVGFDQELFDQVWVKRWHIYEDRPIKDVGELFRVARKLLGTDVSRYAALMELAEKHPRLIVFYNFDYELDMLRVLANSIGINVAEWNGHKHQEVPETEKWLYLVQYTAGSEAWNCVSTDAIVFWSLNYSFKIFEQSKGRIDRMNTPFYDLWYYVLMSDSPVDRSIYKSLSTKTDFNEQRMVKNWT